MGKSFIVHLKHEVTGCVGECHLIDITNLGDKEVYDKLVDLSPTKHVMFVPGLAAKYVAASKSVENSAVFEPYYNPETGESHEFFLRYVH